MPLLYFIIVIECKRIACYYAIGFSYWSRRKQSYLCAIYNFPCFLIKNKSNNCQMCFILNMGITCNICLECIGVVFTFYYILWYCPRDSIIGFPSSDWDMVKIHRDRTWCFYNWKQVRIIYDPS